MSQLDLREALDTLVGEPTVDGGLFDRVAGGVRRRRRRAGTAVVAAVAAVMLGSPLAIHALSAPRPPREPVAGDTANQAAAERDVAARLAAFPAPRGSRPLPGPPPGVRRIPDPWFEQPGPNETRQTRWLSYSGDMNGAYLSLYAAQMAGESPSSENAPGDRSFEVDWSWPDVNGQMVWRSARVTVLPFDGLLLMQVDVWAFWLPARPPDLAIGSGAVSVTVTAQTKTPGMGDATVPARTLGPTTITDPARVAAVASLVDGLSMALPGQGGFISCPNDRGGSIRVDFTDVSGRLLGRLVMTLSGCTTIRLTAGGTTAQLTGADDGPPLGQQILALLGLDWTLATR